MTIKVAWRRADPDIERDARALWAETQTLQPDRMVERLSELCIAAYADGEIAGVASAGIRHADRFNCKLAMFRCLVSPRARMHKLATTLTLQTFDVLEAWSRDNPAEGVMGMGAIIRSRALIDHDRHAVWPDTKLTFVGFTDAGEQFRLKWFEHAVVGEWKPAAAKR